MTILTTKDYDLFEHIKDNRIVNMSHPKSRALLKQMRKYGWLDAFPLMVRKHGKKFTVIDGQHRLATAKQLGFAVKYVVCDQDIDIAELNNTSRSWTPADYVHRFMANDNEHYNTLWVFHQRYGLALSTCATLLYGTSSGHALLKDGDFEVRDTVSARQIFEVVTYLRTINHSFNIDKMARAFMYCMRVEGFDKKRFMENVERCSQLLNNAKGSQESVLAAVEEIYNFGRHERLPLKFMVEEQIRKEKDARFFKG